MKIRTPKINSILQIITIFLAAEFYICTNITIADPLPANDRLIQQIRQSIGHHAAQRLYHWMVLIDKNKDKSIEKKLILVNRFFNRIRVISDKKHWGKEDYWATPAELLVTNGGDSEDFAIAKYFTLKALGVPIDKMRMVYVKAKNSKQTHMILAYYPHPKQEPLILDNIVKSIQRGSKRKDLTPVYSFNGDYLWLAQELKGRDEMVGSSTRIKLWKKLKSRMKKEKRDLAIRH